MITVTPEQLKKIMPFTTIVRARTYAKLLTEAMAEFDINTPIRAAAFIAQIAHESGSLNYTRELASGVAYEGRKDLGNIYPGDGRRYKGRGLLQITGRANTAACGEALGLDLLTWPELLEEPKHAARSAAWWWKTHGLNELADTGDVKAQTKRINGGLNGLAEREGFYARACRVFGVGG